MSIISNLSVFIIFLTLAQFSQVFSSAAATQDTNFTFLVTGGYRPEKHTLAKYLVSLRRHKHREYFGDDHFCGGCIIGPRIILTAAHCLTGKRKKSTPIGAQDVRVVAKTTNRLVQTSDTLMLSVEVIRMHPSYDPKTKANDIGIVKLEDDIEMDGILAATIQLANKPSVPETYCTVIGWGRILENGPLAADAIYVDVEIWENTFCSFYEKYAKGMLCVGNWDDSELDACHGDSGGPLICESKLVGLVSFGRGCASGIPGVYTDVWYHRKWIAENKCNCDVVGSRYLILFVNFILIVL